MTPRVKLTPEGDVAVRLDDIAEHTGRPWIVCELDSNQFFAPRALSDDDVTGWADYTAPNTETEETTR